jgi:folate-binding protein YgfZ
MSRSSPLDDLTRASGARFVDVSGWRMPSDFGDFLAEYQSVRTQAVVFDQSARGKVQLTGPDAANFLHNLCTNDILNLPVGGGCEAFFTTATAKIVEHALIYHVRSANGQDALWLDVAPGRAARLVEHLERYHIAERFEIADRTQEFAQLHLAGPTARVVLQSALGAEVPNLEPWQHMERTIGESATCHIRRNDALAIEGYDLVCLAARGAAVWNALLAAGASPAGATCYEILRIEAGTPLIGRDLDESRFVLEVGRGNAVSYSKGCYLGQEPIVMARDRAGHVNRTFRGLKLAEGPPPPANTKVLNEAGQEVGITTSSTLSPRFGPIALGYLRRGFESAGTALRIDSRFAEVVALPFSLG